MNKSIGWSVVCLLGAVACNVEHYEDCSDPFADGDGFETGRAGNAGTKPTGGNSAGKAGSGGSSSASAGTASGSASAGSAGSGGQGNAGSAHAGGGSASAAGGEAGAGGAPTPVVPITPCEQEHDCAPGYNCNLDTHQCLPADQETCGELDSELACTNRRDCTPVYGGMNCSCGSNCQCHGGEPGCVCERFGFVTCE